MKSQLIKSLIYTGVGALLGLGYYYLVGCKTGSCAITSSLYSTMIYTGLIGFILSLGSCGGCCGGGSCDIDKKDQ